jgi:glucose/arabinose dehydrogenase
LNFQHRNYVLALAAAAFITVAGCSSQDQTAVVSEKAPAAKPKPAAAPKKAPEQKAPEQQAPQPQASNKKAPAPGPTVTLPKGTAMTATVSQTITASKSKVGDSFAATLATPIKVDAKTVIPKGAKLTGHIVAIKKHEMKVALASVIVRGKSVPLETISVSSAKTQPAATQTSVKSTDQPAVNKDVVQLAAKTQLTFKLAKPAAIPVKATPVKKGQSPNRQ